MIVTTSPTVKRKGVEKMGGVVFFKKKILSDVYLENATKLAVICWMLSCRVGGGIAGGRVRGGGDLGLLNEVSASQNVISNMGLFFLTFISISRLQSST